MLKKLSFFYYYLMYKGNDIAYFSTVMLAAFSIGLHLFQLIMLFNIPDNIITPVHLENHRYERWVNSIIFFTPIMILSFFVIRKEKLEKYNIPPMQAKKGYLAWAVYLTLSISLLIILLIREGVKKGTL